MQVLTPRIYSYITVMDAFFLYVVFRNRGTELRPTNVGRNVRHWQHDVISASRHLRQTADREARCLAREQEEWSYIFKLPA